MMLIENVSGSLSLIFASSPGLALVVQVADDQGQPQGQEGNWLQPRKVGRTVAERLQS